MSPYRINAPAPPPLEVLHRQLRRAAAPHRTLSDRARWAFSVVAGVALSLSLLAGGLR